MVCAIDLFCAKEPRKNTESVHCVRGWDSEIQPLRQSACIHHSIVVSSTGTANTVYAARHFLTIDVGLVCAPFPFHVTNSFRFYFFLISESFFFSVFSVQTVFCGWAAATAAHVCVYVFVHIHIGNWFYFYSTSKQSTVYLTCHAYKQLSQLSYLMIFMQIIVLLYTSHNATRVLYNVLIVPPNDMHSPNNRFGEKHLPGLRRK